MKITVNLSGEEAIKECSGLKTKGPAVKSLALEALRMRQRRMLGAKVISGERYANLPKIEKLRQDRAFQ